ncbi:uncharacterized protein LOC123538920 [Mercenaria mercenaria]|uniref:uncharacterized protein LOC123538920 n=1 Tax=Mercenaria mercenaria TaxID=6596 RepID=UPI00234EA0F7|nr:uncharacterized protein LOC123538920 [Mercenaria mercenaria]
MGDKYYRLVSLLVNICPEPLRELFLTQAKADPGTTYTTLDSYLVYKRHQLTQLILKHKLRQDQFDLLFPTSGAKSAHVSQWDISLLSLIITHFFGNALQKNTSYYINELRDVRNIVLHMSSTSDMSDSTFDDTWQRLETATLFLANQHGAAYGSQIKQKINDAKLNNMPDLGNTLCVWFNERISQMQSGVVDISKDTKDIQAHASESVAILRSVTINKTGPAGDKVKRMRTVDQKLKRMQDSFERTMNTEIPDNFDAPPEIDKIKTKLRDSHLVIVAGHSSSLYLATALTAVKDIDYNVKRCAEMQCFSEWSHIDPEDVDFVLCCYPFGRDSYDEEKAKGMAGIFSSVQETVKEECDEKKLDVLIATDIGILNEFKEKHYHDILEDVITLYHSTSEAQPADLTVARCTYNCSLSIPASTQTLIGQTEMFLKHYEIPNRHVDPSIMRGAKTEFKAHKSVVLTGPRKSGKTSLAVELAASYNPLQVLLLAYPEQVQHVDHNRTHLIIIDDFAGKYGFDKIQIWNWYKTFDLLHIMKTAGKLNIIITCDKQQLEKCMNEIGPHPLLEHTMELHRQSILVKQEMSSNLDSESQTRPITEETVATQDRSYYFESDSPSKSKATRLTSVDRKNVCFNLRNIFGNHQAIYCASMCFTKDKSIYAAVNTTHMYITDYHHYLVYHDKNTNSTSKYAVKDDINKMCCTSSGDIVTVLNPGPFSNVVSSCINVLRITDGSAIVIKTMYPKELVYCRALTCDDDDKIYMLGSDGTINILNTNLDTTLQCRLSIEPNSYRNSVVSPNGHIFINTGTGLLYENFNSKSRSENEHDYLLSSCTCAASEEPYTIFVKDYRLNRLDMYNTNCEKISEIPFPFPNMVIYHMMFDEACSRLVIYEGDSKKMYEIFLK